jgi:hypothetical protein
VFTYRRQRERERGRRLACLALCRSVEEWKSGISRDQPVVLVYAFRHFTEVMKVHSSLNPYTASAICIHRNTCCGSRFVMVCSRCEMCSSFQPQHIRSTSDEWHVAVWLQASLRSIAPPTVYSLYHAIMSLTSGSHADIARLARRSKPTRSFTPHLQHAVAMVDICRSSLLPSAECPIAYLCCCAHASSVSTGCYRPELSAANDAF